MPRAVCTGQRERRPLSIGMRALELYCGIGGFTAAVGGGLDLEVVAAVDASSHVVETYNRNFEPVARQRNILQMDVEAFAAYDAQLWWMSPPCAPFTRRGLQLDLSDHRTVSYLRVVRAIAALRPAVVAMENVEGFASSQAREQLLTALEGYAITEWVLCPTALGVPNKRPRFYLVAQRDAQAALRRGEVPERPLTAWDDYIESDVDDRYRVPDDILERYGRGFHVLDREEPYTTCFTGSYGKSWNFTGSYLRLPDGGLRRFTPREVLNFLGFDAAFDFPSDFDDRQRYKYAGNSLSLTAVRHVLATVTSR